MSEFDDLIVDLGLASTVWQEEKSVTWAKKASVLARLPMLSQVCDSVLPFDR